MKFNSQSVVLGRSVNYRFPVETPPSFARYKFYTDVLKKAVDEFNIKLNQRPLVTMHMGDIKVDVIRLVPTSDSSLAMWLVVKEKDIEILHEKEFNIVGDVYFAGDSETDVFHMVINDVTYDEGKGIFTNRKQLTS